MTSVGFGNVASNTEMEKAFTICMMIFGCKFYFIYNTNSGGHNGVVGNIPISHPSGHGFEFSLDFKWESCMRFAKLLHALKNGNLTN